LGVLRGIEAVVVEALRLLWGGIRVVRLMLVDFFLCFKIEGSFLEFDYLCKKRHNIPI
jgi:hypothetical protein